MWLPQFAITFQAQQHVLRTKIDNFAETLAAFTFVWFSVMTSCCSSCGPYESIGSKFQFMNILLSYHVFRTVTEREVIIPGVQVWNVNFSFLKKHVKFGRMIKSDLFKVCSIACCTFFPSFGQFVNTTPVKIFPFCCEPFTETFFHIFVRCSASASSMQTSENRKEASLVSKPQGVELTSAVLPTCREPVLSYVTDHCYEEK